MNLSGLEVGRDRWARRFGMDLKSVGPAAPPYLFGVNVGCDAGPAIQPNQIGVKVGRDRWARRFAACLAPVLALLVASGCATRTTAPAQLADSPPPAPREFRAVWVATVANIDWPSRPGLLVEQQRTEMLAILDRARRLNLNAVVLQVRPAADALYASRLEPWSEYLTGAQGVAPQPYYDPLRVWIEEAHRRGLALHAWLNPYRARHSSARSPNARTHIANVDPQAVKRYDTMAWMDPGDPIAFRQTIRVVRDIAARYDVDGIHVDDYFYPYPVRSAGDFPDEATWQRYRAGGGTLDRASWRRSNVDALIEEMYRTVHEVKPWVQVGVSPFGIGKPSLRPRGIAGFSQYDDLYADVELWLQRGWLDYLAPQLYWRIEQQAQAFPVLLEYWQRQNTLHRHVWPGLTVSSVATGTRAWPAEEIVHQIELIRAHARDGASAGEIHFSMVALMRDRGGVATRLEQGPYAQPALVPATPWLSTKAPHAPRVTLNRDGGTITVSIRPSWFGVRPATFAVWRRQGGQWHFTVVPATARTIDLAGADVVVVSAVDRLGNESARVPVVGGARMP